VTLPQLRWVQNRLAIDYHEPHRIKARVARSEIPTIESAYLQSAGIPYSKEKNEEN
jgi:hypothetical protein